eukprot:763205-Hanusia_phi.AAC.3
MLDEQPPTISPIAESGRGMQQIKLGVDKLPQDHAGRVQNRGRKPRTKDLVSHLKVLTSKNNHLSLHSKARPSAIS